MTATSFLAAKDFATVKRSIRFAILLAAFSSLVAPAAGAQEVRNYTGSARVGEEIRFDHWLNYQESTCFDRGFVRIALRSQPRLGRVRLERSRVRTSEGACTNPLSVVIVFYRAGRVPGTDQFEYTVQGAQTFLVRAAVTVN